MSKTYTFHVSGTHCASCKILIESILNEQDFISNAKVNLKHETVEISTNSFMGSEELAQILTEKIKTNGYTLSADGFDRLTTGKFIKEKQNGNVIWQAIPIGLIFLALFFLLQRSGILNLGLNGQMTSTTSFIIGLVAAFSTCMAVSGGLLLAISSRAAGAGELSPARIPVLKTRGKRLYLHPRRHLRYSRWDCRGEGSRTGCWYR